MRLPALLLAATLVLAGALAVLSLLIHGGDVEDAALVTIWMCLIVHAPFYSFLPTGTSGLVLAAATLAQWTVTTLIIAKSTRGVRTSRALALSVATILAVAASVITALVLLGYELQFEGP